MIKKITLALIAATAIILSLYWSGNVKITGLQIAQIEHEELPLEDSLPLSSFFKEIFGQVEKKEIKGLEESSKGGGPGILSSTTVRFATWNINRLEKNIISTPYHKWRKIPIAKTMNEIAADIWAIQEVMDIKSNNPPLIVTKKDLDNFIHNTEFFSPEYQNYESLVLESNDHYKLALITRYPVKECRTHKDDIIGPSGEKFQHNAIEVDLQIGQEIVTLITTQLSSISENRRFLETKKLKEIISGLPNGRKIILLGDFNEEDQKNIYSPKEKSLINIFESGLSYVFASQPGRYSQFYGTTSLGSNKRLDYIFVSKNIKPPSSGAGVDENVLSIKEQSDASDHLPVWFDSDIQKIPNSKGLIPASCGGTQKNLFSISASPQTLNIVPEKEYSFKIIVSKTSGFPEPIKVSVQNSPLLNVFLDRDSCTPSDTCAINAKVFAEQGIKNGLLTLTITGTSPSSTSTTKINIMVSGSSQNPIFNTFRSQYRMWKNGPPSDQNFFPIAVWWQNPSLAKKYKELGINTYIQGAPTPDSWISALKSEGMYILTIPGEEARKSGSNSAIIAWTQEEEPDLSDKRIHPERLILEYKKLKEKDPTRPIFLNLAASVAFPEWTGRYQRSNHNEDYIDYVKAADIISFDIYPVAEDYVHYKTKERPVKGKLEYVAYGVEFLKKITEGKKPIWNFIETTNIRDKGRATPDQIKSEVWMSIISGSRGIEYFVHEDVPGKRFDEKAIFKYPETLNAVKEINNLITSLAPILNSQDISPKPSVKTSNGVKIKTMLKEYSGDFYLFAVSMENKPTTAEIKILQKTPDAEVTELNENRLISYSNNQIVDSFKGYEPKIYKIKIKNKPLAKDLSCKIDGTWKNCEALHGQKIEALKISCESKNPSAEIDYAEFTLYNNPDGEKYPQINRTKSYAKDANGYFVLNLQPPLQIIDSGDFVITARCVDKIGRTNPYEAAWSIPWGNLKAEIISASKKEVSRGSSFKIQSKITCIGGECGDVDHILDPKYTKEIEIPSDSFDAMSATTAAETKISLRGRGSHRALFISNHPPSWPQKLEEEAGLIFPLDIDGKEKQTKVIEARIIGDSYISEKTGDMPLEVTAFNVSNVREFKEGGNKKISELYPLLEKSVKWPIKNDWWSAVSPNLNELVQEIINRKDWKKSNNIGFVIKKGSLPKWGYASLRDNSSTGRWKSAKLLLVWGEMGTKGIVPQGSGDPFYTKEENPAICKSLNSVTNKECITSWTVTATGKNGTIWEFFSIARPKISAKIKPASSNIEKIKITVAKDQDKDGSPDTLDCNDNDPSIKECTGCAVCSDPKKISGKCIPKKDKIILCEEDNRCGLLPCKATQKGIILPKQNQKCIVKNSHGTWYPSSCKPTCIDEPLCSADSDGDSVKDYDDKCPNTPKGKKVSPLNGCQLPKNTKFRNKHSTNLSKIKNLLKVEKLKLVSPGNSSVLFEGQSISLLTFNSTSKRYSPIDLDKIILGKGFITIDTKNNKELEALNKEAIITFFNIGFKNPRLLRDGKECKSCPLLSYVQKNASFKAPGFSTYRVFDKKIVPPPGSNGGGSSGSGKEESPRVIEINLSSKTTVTLKIKSLLRLKINDSIYSIEVLKTNNSTLLIKTYPLNKKINASLEKTYIIELSKARGVKITLKIQKIKENEATIELSLFKKEEIKEKTENKKEKKEGASVTEDEKTKKRKRNNIAFLLIQIPLILGIIILIIMAKKLKSK